jgi:AAA domain/UvrD-like helicase C-terminal domain
MLADAHSNLQAGFENHQEVSFLSVWNSMPTILADTFTAALARLSNEEQKQAKLTAYELQANPAHPALSFHRIEKSKDAGFWSVRVSRDLRIIVHKRGDSTALVHVAHHDDAYAWAERRRIEAHPKTGVMQIVEMRELVETITIRHAQSELELVPAPMPPLFAALSPDALLGIGIPQDWLADVAKADEDAFLALTDHLPPEASEALLQYISTGQLPQPAPPVVIGDVFAHPDTQRRFRVLEGLDELKAALDWPMDRWAVFLHPSQRDVVERRFNGPARVMGSAGTGKTVVALHRVMRILKHDRNARVLLTTFSDPLAKALQRKLHVLAADWPGLTERISVSSFLGAAIELRTLATGRKPYLAKRGAVRELIDEAVARNALQGQSPQFLLSEWEHVVDAWQIPDIETYASVPRMGRKNRLGARQRETLWPVFAHISAGLAAKGLLTESSLFDAVAKELASKAVMPFSHIVVDEAQDLGVAELRFLQAIAPREPDALFFAGDIAQRIFQQPFSWKGLGIDARGRSHTLKVNYRTSHQIRKIAERLLPSVVRDVDGEEDDRRGVVSVFDGIDPVLVLAQSIGEEKGRVAALLQEWAAEGLRPQDIGVFYRSPDQRARAVAIVEAAGLPMRSSLDQEDGGVLVGLMHLAKGLEFRAAAIVACDEGVLPLAERIEDVADEFELDEVIATERQLLYVALTRAREFAVISAVTPGSEFLEELG